ncbi:MAG: substrate-binding domain-containing protein [Burkholderiales bacterium]
MHKVSIKPQWTISDADGDSLSPRLLELLAQVHDFGSLSGSCRHSGASYRHAWNLVRQGEAQIGAPLMRMERGKGSTLTPLGEKLVWAGHRIAARLTPLLESLASELEVEIGSVLAADRDLLRVHASHGFAIEKLFDTLAAQHVAVERKYIGSQEAVASLRDGACDMAGFHIPEGEFEQQAFAHYARWFDARDSRIIHVATRHQGLMLAPGNPLKIYRVADLARPGVRFVNRQRGSGTRFLLDCLLDKAKVDAARIAGYEQGEYTHAAVAAYVASGMADVGFGVETPARRFKLEFIPVATERYFLLCRAETLASPSMQTTLAVLRSASYQKAVNELPGYTAVKCGQVDTLQRAFPQYSQAKKARGRRVTT